MYFNDTLPQSARHCTAGPLFIITYIIESISDTTLAFSKRNVLFNLMSVTLARSRATNRDPGNRPSKIRAKYFLIFSSAFISMWLLNNQVEHPIIIRFIR